MWAQLQESTPGSATVRSQGPQAADPDHFQPRQGGGEPQHLESLSRRDWGTWRVSGAPQWAAGVNPFPLQDLTLSSDCILVLASSLRAGPAPCGCG